MPRTSQKSRLGNAEQLENWPAIKRISLVNLFGRYSYPKLEFRRTGLADDDVGILYGDNGTGKTTILKLIYNTLSPARGEGSRTYLAETPFSKLGIELRDGSRIDLIKETLQGSFVYRTAINGVESEFKVNADKDNAVKVSDNPQLAELSIQLRKLDLELLFVQDNRFIRSTYDFITRSTDLQNSVASYFKRAVNWQAAVHGTENSVERPRFQDIEEAQGINLSQVIRLVGDWLSRNAFQKKSTGDEDASNAYLNVIKALSHQGQVKKRSHMSKAQIQKRLQSLDADLMRYRKHGLVGTFPLEEFRQVISDAPTARIDDISNVLSPYLDSVLTRLNAIEEIRSIMELFEGEMRSYLKDKHAHLDVARGPNFFDDTGQALEPVFLSSGERQLVFLFCAALLSRDGRSIFIIDEPELSLNYKWQRQLVSSLVKLARGASTQFIMASHSIEIMSQHKSSLLQLR